MNLIIHNAVQIQYALEYEYVDWQSDFTFGVELPANVEKGIRDS
jgi:hypothetical protein